MKEKLLSLLSDGIMTNDWEYVKEAYKIIKDFPVEKEKVRVSPVKESTTFDISQIENQDGIIHPDTKEIVVYEQPTVETPVKLNVYGNPVPVPTDEREAFREDAELDKKIAAVSQSSPRRPPEEKIDMTCLKCQTVFQDFPRNAPTRTGGDENGRIGIVCDGCKVKK